METNKRINKGFTLIELLVVIAIVAILMVTVVVTINPGQLLAQARDSNRLSDVNTIDTAINLSRVDSIALGSSSITYISIPDMTATSTAGDQCQGLNLPPLPSPYTYHCSASSTYRKVDGTGWIPINFTQMSSGAPFSQIPIDPINQTSSYLFYTYTTDGSTYEVTGILESQKYKTQFEVNPQNTLFPGVLEKGNNLALSELYNSNGLVGYWPLNEGTGTIAIDQSGNGNNGTLACYGSCSNPTWGPGKVGPYSVNFMNNGQPGQQYVTLSNNFPQFLNVKSLTLSAWIYPAKGGDTIFEFMAYDALSGSPPPSYEASSGIVFYLNYSNQLQATVNGQAWPPPDLIGSQPLSINAWHFVVFTFDSNTGSENIYQDGNLIGSQISSAQLNIQNNLANLMGYNKWNGWPFVGYLNDARIYNRALSPAEIQAIYNAQK